MPIAFILVFVFLFSSITFLQRIINVEVRRAFNFFRHDSMLGSLTLELQHAPGPAPGLMCPDLYFLEPHWTPCIPIELLDVLCPSSMVGASTPQTEHRADQSTSFLPSGLASRVSIFQASRSDSLYPPPPAALPTPPSTR